MLKLNKCRTLYEFNEATFVGMQNQVQQNTSKTEKVSDQEKDGTNNQSKNIDSGEIQRGHAQSQKELDPLKKTENFQDIEKDNLQNRKQDEGEDLSAHKGISNQNKSETNKKSEDLLSEKNDKSSEKEEEKQESQVQSQLQQQQQSQYLFFGPDEFLITTYQYENGWWFGYKDTKENEQGEPKMGFFPSNFVQVIEEYAQKTEQEEASAIKESVDMNEAFTWSDYAKYSFLNDDKILIEERTKKLNDFRAPEHRNPDGILGYKKIKIHESRSHAVNPSKGGVVKTSQIAIKDQSQVGKAYRQMNHYFDYDAWIEDRNKNPPPKAKADPTKKKTKKKVLDW